MKKIFFNFINFIIIHNFLYRAYLRIPKKIDFEGTPNFNPLTTKKKKLDSLLQIEDNYFTSKKKISLKMHSFDWLTDFKNSGGLHLLKKSRNLILDWCDYEYKLGNNVWNDILVSRRINNLLINFDFYGSSANGEFQKKIKNLIYFHYKHLLFLNKFHKEKYDNDLEISKSLLLASKFFGTDENYQSVINLIKKQTNQQINNYGFHKSINAIEQAKFIHQLIEIKNILLFYQYNKWPEINNIITDMTSLLKNLFHRDLSLALFNATNNNRLDYVTDISNLQKDIKIKKLNNVNNGITVIEVDKTKLFFDITKPNSKLLNKKIHSGTLSFEMSSDREKIITNCGSSDKYLSKNQVFFRYSAAHSTIIINNTNIAELSEKKGYKRIPENIKCTSEELKDHFVISGSHDGYKKNFGVLTKRTLKISKNGKKIVGTDQMVNLKRNFKNNNYEIRFHLMPDCTCNLTNNDQQVLIKTKGGLAWYFKSRNNKIKIDKSIYIGNASHPLSTNQIILLGSIDSNKKIINWELNKIN